MQDERINQINAELDQLMNLKRQLRTREKNIRGREQVLSQPSQFEFNSVQNLRKQIGDNLAFHMRPVNVGALNEVAWPFFFQASVDFGTDPSIVNTNIQRGAFQVDQEACFLMMSVSRSHNTDGAQLSAVARAPLTVEFIDRQSTRRFQSTSMPLQQIGDNSNPLIMPTPMLVLPNAFIDINVAGIPTVAQATVGNGEIQFSFFGYRVRVENAQKVLSTIFA